ncbi:MAG: DNA-protecting protein DprA, partial [Lachnospiraceae bacterium]|nr:DNA-protecting protein DprA [Lachnospiraceae bacterium]
MMPGATDEMIERMGTERTEGDIFAEKTERIEQNNKVISGEKTYPDMEKGRDGNRGEIRYVSALDPEFPDRLRWIPKPPAGLYIRGRFPDENRPSVAVIGSRDASAYGIGIARHFSSVLSDAGVQIISGLARGIDGVGQRAAAEGGHAT